MNLEKVQVIHKPSQLPYPQCWRMNKNEINLIDSKIELVPTGDTDANLHCIRITQPDNVDFWTIEDFLLSVLNLFTKYELEARGVVFFTEYVKPSQRVLPTDLAMWEIVITNNALSYQRHVVPTHYVDVQNLFMEKYWTEKKLSLIRDELNHRECKYNWVRRFVEKLIQNRTSGRAMSERKRQKKWIMKRLAKLLHIKEVPAAPSNPVAENAE